MTPDQARRFVARHEMIERIISRLGKKVDDVDLLNAYCSLFRRDKNCDILLSQDKTILETTTGGFYREEENTCKGAF